MALVLADLVQETTSTTGTGTLTLTGAVTGYQTFAAIGNANTTYYRIKSGTDSEVGIGTYTLSGTTLSRDTVLYSTAGGTTKITVAAGATVICTYPAERAVALDAVGNLGVGVQTATSKVAVKDVTNAASGSLEGSLLELTQTWNTTGNPTAIGLNVTNTASGSASKLMDLQVDGNSKFSVDKTGFARTRWLYPLTDGGYIGCGTSRLYGNNWGINYQLNAFNASRFIVSLNSIDNTDVVITGDAANTLAQRNGTNAQTFRLYNTYTDASNYSRLTFTTNTNNHQITSEAAGSGALKPICEKFYSSASAPTTTNIPDGFSCMWKNTTDSTLKLYANDGGTLKSILLV